MNKMREVDAMVLLIVIFLTLLGCTPDTEATAAAPAASDTLEVAIEEWPVPFEDSRPRDPYVGPDGRVWFVGQKSDYVAYLDPETGEFEKYDLDRGTGPHTVIVGDDGTVWIAGNMKAYIGKLDPKTGTIEKIAMPDPKAADPHTMAFTSDGDIWFTLQVSNRIGYLDTETNEIRIVEVPTGSARPYGLKVDENDDAWVVLLATNKLAFVDRETMEIREVELPREATRPRRLGITSDGSVWYVDYAEGYLGRYNPATEEIEEWQMPGGNEAQPYGMAVDASDRVWFVETGSDPNRFVGFDPGSESFVASTEIPSGGGTVRHMYFHEPTGSVWFGTDTNNIGRAVVRTATAQ